MERVGILQLACLETLSSSLFPLILDFFLVGGRCNAKKRWYPFPKTRPERYDLGAGVLRAFPLPVSAAETIDRSVFLFQKCLTASPT